MDLPQATASAFFSYARQDSDFALRLAEDLKAAGASVWLDQLDIQPGQRWDGAVEEALTRCARMLVVLTPASVNSTNVMDEVSFALEERKTIIPILHRDCTIPFRLRRLQHLDFREDYSRALKDLIRTLVSGTETGPARPTAAIGSGDTVDVQAVERLTFEQLMAEEHPPQEEFRADVGQPIRNQEYGLAAATVADQPLERHPFDLGALWPLLDRFGGLCWLALAFALFPLLGISLVESLTMMSGWLTRIFGIACPAIAAIVPAIRVKRLAGRHIPAIFGIASLLTPILGLSAMRAGVEATGSTGLAAIAAGLADILLTIPFIVAGLFAVGATTLPNAPASLRAGARVALLAASSLMVFIAAKNISAFNGIATAGSGGLGWPWLAGWLVRLVIPGGIPGIE